MLKHYILEGKTPVLVSKTEWARAFEIGNRHVDETYIGDLHVSTVFLGLDHQFGDGPPLLFETMIFGGPEDQYQTRCSTWEEAEQMHERAITIAYRATRKDGSDGTETD